MAVACVLLSSGSTGWKALFRRVMPGPDILRGGVGPAARLKSKVEKKLPADPL